jgi:2,4-dienoyl-CoA reductase-like NADH-dependent reductase (Old Yellow Enzyme family)/thioredoxin reductase
MRRVMMKKMFPHLCEPIKIGNVELKNRMVAAPMVGLTATENGYITDRMLELYRQRSQGGFSLVVVEATGVRKESRITARMLLADHPRRQVGLADLASVIHENGAKAAIQLADPGGNADSSWMGVTSWAPSNVSLRPWVAPPKEMTEDEIQYTIDCHVKAAVICRRAGFDMIMIHGAHGFLPHQFMTPYLNRRTDKWGDPALYAMEVIRRMKEKVDCPVYIRISGDDFLGLTPPERIRAFATTYTRDPDRSRGTANLDHMLKIVPLLVEAGSDAIDVSGGTGASMDDYWLIQPLYKKMGVIAYLADAIKKVSKVPVITAGKLMNPRLGESIIANGRADLVALGRASYADTEYPKKVMENRPQEIRMCTACDYCTALMVFGGSTVRCAVNYDLGRMPYEYELQSALRPKKVLVVGGGVAGMEAARVVSLKGHTVVLYEKDSDLGGCITNLATRIPHLNTANLKHIVKWQVQQLDQLGVDLRLGREVTSETIDTEKPDVVILATGARPRVPQDIPGVDRSNVVILDDYLTKKRTDMGMNVAVVGGDHGAEVACSLARDGKKVTLIAKRRRVAGAPYLAARWPLLLDYLRDAGVKILTEAATKNIGDKVVVIVDKGGKEDLIEADTVLLAPARFPNNELAEELKFKVPELYEIGDCVEPKHLQAAIHSACHVARKV